jgi:uncharacterized protein involved in exopolysaccharide biosynthesis
MNIWPFSKPDDADMAREETQKQMRSTADRIGDLVKEIHKATREKKDGMAR